MRLIFAIFKMTLFLVLCLAVIPAQGILLLFHTGKYARIVPYFWMNSVCKILRIKVSVKGQPFTAAQTLYTSNHLSYLDIPVIGSVLKTRFVSRKDAANWPLFGYLVKLGQTAFVERSRTAVKSDAGAVSNVIDNDQSLIIFPEGTSTDGQDVLNFKSSLFSLAIREDKPNLHIQPITLKVVKADGAAPKTQTQRDIYAWHNGLDTPFFIHLWHFANHKGAEIELTFHDAIKANAFENRKILAKTCHDTVSNGLKNTMTN